MRAVSFERCRIAGRDKCSLARDESMIKIQGRKRKKSILTIFHRNDIVFVGEENVGDFRFQIHNLEDSYRFVNRWGENTNIGDGFCGDIAKFNFAVFESKVKLEEEKSTIVKR